jgi:hypothetical protein
MNRGCGCDAAPAVQSGLDADPLRRALITSDPASGTVWRRQMHFEFDSSLDAFRQEIREFLAENLTE